MYPDDNIEIIGSPVQQDQQTPSVNSHASSPGSTVGAMPELKRNGTWIRAKMIWETASAIINALAGPFPRWSRWSGN